MKNAVALIVLIIGLVALMVGTPRVLEVMHKQYSELSWEKEYNE